MGKNQLIHGNEFHLLKQAEIHKATGKLVESLNLAAGSTGGFDLYKVVEAYFTDLEKRKDRYSLPRMTWVMPIRWSSTTLAKL